MGEGARTAPRCEERARVCVCVCACPEPGRRVTALGDEGLALTGKSGHRGGWQRLGGDPRWQRLWRRLHAGRAALVAATEVLAGRLAGNLG